MSGNTFGKLFTVTTFGESHGPALGAIVDGCPPGIAISEEDLQGDLDRRRPGSSRHTTQRKSLYYYCLILIPNIVLPYILNLNPNPDLNPWSRRTRVITNCVEVFAIQMGRGGQ